MSTLGPDPPGLFTVVLLHLLALQIIYTLQNQDPLNKVMVTSAEREGRRGQYRSRGLRVQLCIK